MHYCLIPAPLFQANIGTGFYDSESAVGFTSAGRVSNDVALYLGITTDIDGDEGGGTIGASYQR